MAFSHQLLLLALLLLPLTSFADPIYYCKNNFTSNNNLEANIDKVVSDLLARTHDNLYATSTFGSGGDAVFGLSWCRGDVGKQDCANCMVQATQKVRLTCHESADSRIWYDYCFLRHDTSNFIGSADTTYIRGFITVMEASDLAAFNVAVRQLMSWVNVKASLSGSKFGMGSIRFSGDASIYGMAQCTADLSGSACMDCLEKATSRMMSDCGKHNGCVNIFASCVLRYETYNFLLAAEVPKFLGSAAAVPAPAPAPSTSA